MAPAKSRNLSALWALGLVASSLGSLTACGSAQGAEASPANTAAAATSAESDQEHITAVHLAKCGSCHVRVEPGTRSRGEIELALGRHHRRARLTDREWALLVDYLAKDPEALSASAPRLAAGVTR